MNPFEDMIWLFSSNTKSRGIVRLNIAEGALLYKYCRLYKDSVVLEIGRKYGGSTAIIASALEKGCLYSMDIVDHPEAHSNTDAWKDKIHFITCDSKHTEWNMEIDLLFIDGDHSYEGVKSDVAKFSPFVRDNGVMIFHDVLGKKKVLQPIIKSLLDGDWAEDARADSMIVLKRGEE